MICSGEAKELIVEAVSSRVSKRLNKSKILYQSYCLLSGGSTIGTIVGCAVLLHKTAVQAGAADSPPVFNGVSILLPGR